LNDRTPEQIERALTSFSRLLRLHNLRAKRMVEGLTQEEERELAELEQWLTQELRVRRNV